MAYTVAVLADHQIPYHDENAIEAVNKYIHDLKPDEIVINGDFMDFPMLSTKFRRNHTTRYALQQDLDEGKYVLKSHRKAAPKAKITLLEGNHELRLRTFIEEQADVLEPLLDSALNVESLLGLDELGIEWVGTQARQCGNVMDSLSLTALGTPKAVQLNLTWDTMALLSSLTYTVQLSMVKQITPVYLRLPDL